MTQKSFSYSSIAHQFFLGRVARYLIAQLPCAGAGDFDVECLPSCDGHVAYYNGVFALSTFSGRRQTIVRKHDIFAFLHGIESEKHDDDFRLLSSTTLTHCPSTFPLENQKMDWGKHCLFFVRVLLNFRKACGDQKSRAAAASAKATLLSGGPQLLLPSRRHNKARVGKSPEKNCIQLCYIDWQVAKLSLVFHTAIHSLRWEGTGSSERATYFV